MGSEKGPFRVEGGRVSSSFLFLPYDELVRRRKRERKISGRKGSNCPPSPPKKKEKKGKAINREAGPGFDECHPR